MTPDARVTVDREDGSTPVMEPNRLSSAFVVFGAAVASLFSAGCASQLTDPSPVAVSTPPLDVGSTVPAYESDPTGRDERGTNVAVVSDRSDPVLVARAFVTVLTNRGDRETKAEWRSRLRPWATPAALDALSVREGNPVFDAEVARRGGRAVGVVVGDATMSREASSAAVLVVIDETVVFDGQPLDVENFVTWRLTLDRLDDGWHVSGAGFGGGS